MALATAAAAVVLAFALVGHSAESEPAHTQRLELRDAVGPSKLAVLILENRSYGQVIGNPKAPYLNSLARRGALETRYYAVTHPSLPNYIALTTGGYKTVESDCTTCVARGRTLVNQLDAAGISWRAYFEDRPGHLTAGFASASLYNRHYDPFVYEPGALQAPATTNDIEGFTSLDDVLAEHDLPRFTWIAPNVLHDGHSSSLRAADSYAHRLVPRLLRALGRRGVLFITWDEGRRSDRSGAHGTGGGHVPLIAVGGAAAPHTRVNVRANHYALLKTIEAAFRLHPLGHAASRSTPMLSGLLLRRPVARRRTASSPSTAGARPRSRAR